MCFVHGQAKRCKWCKNWSSSLCPWPLQNTVLSAWSPLLPWHRGSRNKPIGDACKVCMVVSCMCIDCI